MKNLYIFAGVNGAGKSTFYINQLEDDDFYGARINSDEIVREFGDWNNPIDQNRAGRLAIKLRNSYLQKGIDFNIETTLSGHSIVKFIEKAKMYNYHITVFYVGLNSVELAKQRVAIRVAKKGHDIEEKTIERRFVQSFDNLVKIIPIADVLYFYDNSQVIANEQQQKFANLEKIAEKRENNIYIQKNIEWFDRVINKAKEMNFVSKIAIRSK
ncbi:MAG: zeta toxin family protein [Cardiobacteriaceae bacterium]|nr:zeta toxin family protein [Cardiobacteriaceae bacterium]